MNSFTKQHVNQIKHRCRQTDKSLRAELESMGAITTDERSGALTYLDRGAKILGVAHADFVNCPMRFDIGSKRCRIYCPRLDNRIGVWTILDYLPSVGIKLDILLTDAEEIGQSTAAYFTTEKKYNWLAQFDRRGDGAHVVTYDYDSPKWHKAIKQHWRIDRGTFSDISQLEHLGASAMNVGGMFDNEHTSHCEVEARRYFSALNRFVAFYRQNKSTHFEHEQRPKYYYKPRSYGGKANWKWANKDGGKHWQNTYRSAAEAEDIADAKRGNPRTSTTTIPPMTQAEIDALWAETGGAAYDAPEIVGSLPPIGSDAYDSKQEFQHCEGCDDLIRFDRLENWGSYQLCKDCYDAATD